MEDLLKKLSDAGLRITEEDGLIQIHFPPSSLLTAELVVGEGGTTLDVTHDLALQVRPMEWILVEELVLDPGGLVMRIADLVRHWFNRDQSGPVVRLVDAADAVRITCRADRVEEVRRYTVSLCAINGLTESPPAEAAVTRPRRAGRRGQRVGSEP